MTEDFIKALWKIQQLRATWGQSKHRNQRRGHAAKVAANKARKRKHEKRTRRGRR